MVDVGMGEQDEVHVGSPVGLRVAVAGLDGLVALVHAAVDAEALAAGLNHVAGARDGLGCAEKLYFHRILSLPKVHFRHAGGKAFAAGGASLG